MNKLLVATFVVLGFASLSRATTSSCPEAGTAAADGSSNILCYLYENAGDYPLTYSSANQTPGYVVIMNSGDPTSMTDEMNQSLWGDVIDFLPNTLQGTGSTELTLLFNPLTFPDYSTVVSGPFFFMSKNPSGDTVYDPNQDGTAVFHVLSPLPSTIPEPSHYAFLLTALVVIGGVLRHKRAAAAARD